MVSLKLQEEIVEVETLLGERIANSRMTKNLSQSQLARRIGVKKKTIENWELDRVSPRANQLDRLAGVLNVPIIWLLAGGECPPEVNGPPDQIETAELESKIEHASNLVNKLSMLLAEIKANSRQIQREFDDL